MVLVMVLGGFSDVLGVKGISDDSRYFEVVLVSVLKVLYCSRWC